MAPAAVAVDEIQQSVAGLVAQRLAVDESGLLGEILDHELGKRIRRNLREGKRSFT
jgi:hypothetical protein